MPKIKEINLSDYDYYLPDSRIAQFPLENRDQSKLLIYNNGLISTDIFSNLSQTVPENSLIIFNQTKVIRARLQFEKTSGAKIEIFCLEPYSPSDIQQAFQQKGKSIWKCFVGNAKKWKSGNLILALDNFFPGLKLLAKNIQKLKDSWLIEFSWNYPELSFGEILQIAGLVPLPPYITRNSIEKDKTDYQTIFAKHDGSVAAPTAGLHFTENVFNSLQSKNILTDFITLHVGAGTFKPLNTNDVREHLMHGEKIVFKKDNILNLISNLNRDIIAVGTTTVRSLESLYWYGVKIKVYGQTDFNIEQWDSYKSELDIGISTKESLQHILDYMQVNDYQEIQGVTNIMILPGYTFRVVDHLITNFHMPKSTLLLLISAFIGDDWQKIYDFALKNDFRFLSYGDSNFLFGKKN